MHDIQAFTLIYCLGAASYLILTFFPHSPQLAYLATILMITSVGGWDNI